MKQTTVAVGPSPTKGTTKPVGAPTRQRKPSSEFIVAVSNMSWQLALVVLVPLIGGYKLDQQFHTFPLLTVAGLVLAMIGSASVLHHQLQVFGPPPTQKGRRS